jgi:hypothetical protein
MDLQEIKKVIELHKKWLSNKQEECRADFWGANLRGADFRGVDFRDANFQSADLKGADFRNADLRNADLQYANLRSTDFRDADLRGAKLSHYNILPPSGEFICWKKGDHKKIIKIRCPWWARRTSPLVGRKCRLEFGIVESIEDQNGKPCEMATGPNYPGLEYRVGKIVAPDAYDPDIRIECSHGIHVFLTRSEAENWN